MNGQDHQEEPQPKAKAGSPRNQGGMATATNASMVVVSSQRRETLSTKGRETGRPLKKKPDFLRDMSKIQALSRSHRGPLTRTIETTGPVEGTSIITDAQASTERGRTVGSRTREKISETGTLRLILQIPHNDKDTRRGTSIKIGSMGGRSLATMIGRTGAAIGTPGQEDSIRNGARKIQETPSARGLS